MAVIPLSVQMYTIRDHVAKDFAGTVRELAKIGYKGVELAGYGDLKTAAEVRKACDDAGVVVSGVHTGIDGLLSDPNKVADEQKVLGNVHVMCPWAPLDGKTEAEVKEFAKKLQQAGEAAAKVGLTLGYHNHSFEFKPIRKGLDAMDVLFAETKAEHVKAELDLFWVKHGGHDPAAYMEKFGSRCILVHIKDMEVGPDRRFANVGEGILDFPKVFTVGQKIGVRWYVVEQDNCYGQDPMDAVRNSFANLRKMGYV